MDCCCGQYHEFMARVPTRRALLPDAASRKAVAFSTGARGIVLDPIITMNSTGIIQSASDSVEQVFGWTPAELYGKNVNVLIPEPRRSALDRYLDRYRQSDTTKSLKRTRMFHAIRKDGKPLQIELSMSRADLPLHLAPFFIGIVRDITNRIEVGPDFSEQRSYLHDLIAQQTCALASANLRLHLADRLASLGTLAAGLGHDMNNVLLPIRARLNALEHAGIDEASIAHVTAIRRSISYLQHLSDGLHFLSLDPDSVAEPGEQEESADLAEWWNQMGPLLRKAVPRAVKVTSHIPVRLPSVNLAPHWLTQAVLNLIVNAGESIPQGRKDAHVTIDAEASDDRKFVRLSVKDNGQGMSHGVQRRAFDLFFTTKTRSMGTGLGLPLVRNVAIRAGGTVEIHSSPKTGTTVTLVLPASKKRPKAGKGLAPAGRVVVVSIRDKRRTALITQVLIANNFQLSTKTTPMAEDAEFWITEPSRQALEMAIRWRKSRPSGHVLLLGAPSKSSEAAWKEQNASVIDPADDFGSIRHAIVDASRLASVKQLTDTKPKKKKGALV